jgi:hypothetical protein
MSFLKETDYSGSRTYDGQPSARVLISHFRLRVALTFAWARLKIERFIRLGVASMRPSVPVQHGFTLLGAKRRSLPIRRPITDVFPIPNSDDRRRKMRNDNEFCL